MSRPGAIKLEALVTLAALVSGAVSCTQSYSWGSYEDSVRRMCVKDKGYDAGRALERLTNEIEWAEAGEWTLVPPGKYMHVGYLHYLAGDAEAAKRYFLKEKEAFPESARFVDGMLERMK